MMRRIMIFAGLVALHSPAKGQYNPAEFQHITVDQGLSQNVVSAILQDTRGFLWFGTFDGLNRYDGYGFKIFKPNPSDSNRISSTYILSLCEDADGDLWVGTRGGLNRFNRSTEIFKAYTHEPGDSTSLSDNSVRSVLIDREGNLWAGTLSGLDRFDRGTESFHRYGFTPEESGRIGGSGILALMEDHAGVLWIGTRGEGLCRLNRETGRIEHVLFENERRETSRKDTIRALIEDRDHVVWYTTWGRGLTAIDEERRRKTRFRNIPGDEHSLASDELWSVLEDAEGNLWIGTAGKGLNKWDRKTKLFHRYPHDPMDASGVSHPVVRSLLLDPAGNLWIGTDMGLDRLNLNQKHMALFRNKPGVVNSLSNNNVQALLQERNGTVWIGTRGGGLNRLDPKSSRFFHSRANRGNREGLRSNYITSLLQDRTGKLWIGTEAGGLNCLNANRTDFCFFLNDPADSTTISSNNVWCLLEGRTGGLWVGTDRGVNRLDFRTGIFTRGFQLYRGIERLDQIRVRCLLEDRQGALWIGTNGEGLMRYDPVTLTLTSFVCERGNPNTLSNDFVVSLYEDRGGSIWIGTWGGGLNRMDRFTETFARFGEEEGLTNSVIYAIQEDDLGNLWLSSNHGIFKYNPSSKTVFLYTPYHGLQGWEFSANACWKNDSGELYFGGTNGFNFFHPDSLIRNDHVPPLVITGFALNDKPVPIGERRETGIFLPVSITESESVVLSYRHNTITLEFAALDFTAPQYNQYAYRLVNQDKEWNHIGSRRFVTFSRMKPGEYVFQVRGANNDATWNFDGTALRIIILPPFWETPFFRALLLAATIGTGLFLLRMRITSMQKRNKRLQVINIELNREISDRRKAEEALQEAHHHLERRVAERTMDLKKINEDLQDALDNVKTLKGMLPICAGCKKVRDDKGYWQQVEVYITEHSDAEFSHGMCPDCFHKYYPEGELDDKQETIQS